MSKLNIDQKNISDLFSNKKADFLIPDYQRPYAWEDVECQTLWDDIFAFAFPDNDYSRFNTNDEYFLGPIVTFRNEDNKQEIIDGQQRLTTLMLLLRAFYAKFGNMRDENSVTTKTNIEKCIWKTNEFGKPNINELKIDSEVASDNDKDEFLSILKSGDASGKKSRYALNYLFFQKKIDTFLSEFPSYFPFLPTRILNNCILLPIEAESQDTALRIFSTLNDRGMPLSDADIFKAQFYKFYSGINKKDEFIRKWKKLEELSEEIFHPISGTPMDELFSRYMYYERSLQGIKSSTTEALRKFYEKDGYKILKKEETFTNISALADFWNDISKQNDERFSDRVLKRLFVLNYAPNGMWNYFTSVYFMKNKDENGLLDDERFYTFLTRITAFIWAYAVTNPGVNALRTPVYAEMVNLVNSKPVDFANFKFEATNIRTLFTEYVFSNIRPITKSMLAWWTFRNKDQELLSLDTVFEIEHIYAKNRQENEKSLSDNKSLELLGNKSFLEKRINIRASDYKFCDKKKYYQGFVNSKGQKKEGTKIKELVDISNTRTDFTEADILERNNAMLDGFIAFLGENGLIKG
jgi:uncharacterized protein with ParB-like and HNH nuclease domain